MTDQSPFRPAALEMTRVFTVAPEVLWRALTDPARLALWWGPRGTRCTACALDLRPGGAWRTDMRAADGSEWVLHGVCAEVSPPHRLVYSWAIGAETAPGSTVTLDIAARGRGSELRLRHEGLAPEAREGHERGWTGAFESLGDHLAGPLLRPNPVGWTTVPVADMDRAVAFYNAVFGLSLRAEAMGDEVMAMFPTDPAAPGSGGALWKGESDLKPGDARPESFFACAGDLAEALSRIEAAGGGVLRGKTSIGPNGFVAHALDTEGNRFGLHWDM